MTRRRERSEPHLPIQTRLMRRHEVRQSVDVAWFVFEFVRAPFDAVERALDDDLVALRRHVREQSVAARELEGLDRFHDVADWLWHRLTHQAIDLCDDAEWHDHARHHRAHDLRRTAA